VPIFFADDTDDASLTAFSQWIVASDWLDEVGSEYGVGAGSVLAVVHRLEPAPEVITDPQIVDLLYAGIAAGTLPDPAAGDVLYLVNFPPRTMVTASTAASCVEFGGYHASARRNGVELAYAVLPTCPGFVRGLTDLEVREVVTSHELIEAATDPVPSNHPGFQLHDPTSSWTALGAEVGDLCARADATGTWREAGFVVQRSWSNAAAALGDPCVPVPTAATYVNVVTDGNGLPRIRPGDHRLLGVTGWATGTTPDWRLLAATASTSDATLTLATTTLGPGKHTTLDVAVSPATPTGTSLLVLLFSTFSTQQYQVLPLRVVVGDPCATYTICEACTAQPGCGFCTATGRCETQGAAGPAESPCPEGAFATWPGSCSGFCAAHGGGCGECASQAGCGWCNTGGTPQCLEASHDYAHPAAGSCAYGDWSFTPDYCPG